MFGMWGTSPFAGGIIGTSVAVRSNHDTEFVFDLIILNKSRQAIARINLSTVVMVFLYSKKNSNLQ